MAIAKTNAPAPLLAPPPSELDLGWLDITERERKSVLAALENFEKTDDGWNIAMYHHMARSVGMDTPLTQHGRKKLAERLDIARGLSSGFGWQVSTLHHYIRSLGVETEITPTDVKAMMANLEEGRADWAATAYHFHHMAPIGVAAPTPKELQWMVDGFNGKKDRLAGGDDVKHGFYLASLQADLKVTPAEKNHLRKILERARAGDNCLELHYHINGILRNETREVNAAAPLPPLKRLRR